MKKLITAAAAALLAVSLLSAQTDITQVTFPKKIFIGDTVELRYTFRSPVDFFSDKEDSVVARNIDVKSLQFEPETDDYTITKASLERTGLSYTFSMTFMPWRTGNIDFPPFDLARAVYRKASSEFAIDLQPVVVSTILQKADDTTLRLPAGPLLLPGTMYTLYGFAIAIIIILILLIRLIVKWPVIYNSRREKKLMRTYARNARNLFRQLRRLEKSGERITDAEFCTELQQLVRRYLAVRFGYDFTTVMTSQFAAVFDKLTAGTMPGKKQDAAEALASVMHRTDYIRYAHDSLDSKRLPAEQYAAKLGERERESLVAAIYDSVNSFEEVQQNA
jgi:hypothetical protein